MTVIKLPGVPKGLHGFMLEKRSKTYQDNNYPGLGDADSRKKSMNKTVVSWKGLMCSSVRSGKSCCVYDLVITLVGDIGLIFSPLSTSVLKIGV